MKLFKGLFGRSNQPRRRKDISGRVSKIECLEGRTLLSATAGVLGAIAPAGASGGPVGAEIAEASCEDHGDSFITPDGRLRFHDDPTKLADANGSDAANDAVGNGAIGGDDRGWAFGMSSSAIVNDGQNGDWAAGMGWSADEAHIGPSGEDIGPSGEDVGGGVNRNDWAFGMSSSAIVVGNNGWAFGMSSSADVGGNGGARAMSISSSGLVAGQVIEHGGRGIDLNAISRGDGQGQTLM